MFQSSHLQLLQSSLDAAALRQRVIANNIANQDTPHFKSKQVVFEELLRQQLDNNKTPRFAAHRTDPRHIPFGGRVQPVTPQIVSNPNNLIQNNGNDVDVEYEMSRMAKNTIWYNGLIDVTAGHFNKLKSVINGSGR